MEMMRNDSGKLGLLKQFILFYQYGFIFMSMKVYTINESSTADRGDNKRVIIMLSLIEI